MIVTVTNAQMLPAATPGHEESSPNATITTPVMTPPINGQRKVRRIWRNDARRQAIRGPMPIRSSSGSPKAITKKS